MAKKLERIRDAVSQFNVEEQLLKQANKLQRIRDAVSQYKVEEQLLKQEMQGSDPFDPNRTDPYVNSLTSVFCKLQVGKLNPYEYYETMTELINLYHDHIMFRECVNKISKYMKQGSRKSGFTKHAHRAQQFEKTMLRGFLFRSDKLKY